MSAKVNDVVDYIVLKLDEAGAGLNLLKLQKLLFYVQAWSLAVHNKRAFNGRFQAWVHGPVNREVFDRFRDTHSLYDRVRLSAVSEDFRAEALPLELRGHIDQVLEAYASFTGSQLEMLTHSEQPWIAARRGLPAASRCETEIDEDLMRDFYSKLLTEVHEEQDAAAH